MELELEEFAHPEGSKRRTLDPLNPKTLDPKP